MYHFLGVTVNVSYYVTYSIVNLYVCIYVLNLISIQQKHDLDCVTNRCIYSIVVLYLVEVELIFPIV